MIQYVKLGFAALLPVIFSVIFTLAEKYTPFKKLGYMTKQIICGVAFGALAVIGTEWGIPINGAQMNCRDAAVLTAGLLFGAPAGIIAGVIGAVERWFAVYWGVGAFTRIACTVSTFVAGIYAALLRKYMFENKKTGWGLSLAIGVVMEVFHLTMVFITNIATPIEAMNVVKVCSAPMIISNSVSVMLASMFLSLLFSEKIVLKQERIRISQTIQRWLLFTVVLAFLGTSYFVFTFQTRLAITQADSILQLGIDETAVDIRESAGSDINYSTLTKNRHIGNTGYILLFDNDFSLLSSPGNYDVNDFDSSLIKNREVKENEIFTINANGKKFLGRYMVFDEYYIVSVLPGSEAFQIRNIAIYVNTFMEIIVFAILFALIYMLIKKVVVNQIKKINTSLSKITGGNLEEVVDVRTNEEFASLSDDINSTVDTLKHYIDEASARINRELEFAKNIQSSALPGLSAVFSNRNDFDVYALMDPAKEVGGDFYDYYYTDPEKLNILIADVSGKGIPAAMFMMRAKTELKALTESGNQIADVFTNGNNGLCTGNDAGMFVTAWQGGIDLSTGEVNFVNAGHNPPLICRGGKFEYLKSRAGLVLAGMEGFAYKSQQVKLEPGDIIFLYTDGVTEATNSENELYGEERLLQKINSAEFENMQQLCGIIRRDVDDFVGDAPQFDDITMLAFRYNGTPTITFEEAAVSDIPAVTEFVENELSKIDCPMKSIIQINVAIDEIYSNIVKYGYPDRRGPVTVKVLFKEDFKTVFIRFSDEGVPYNPLNTEEPDTTLSADDRAIGGLGIFMVKKTMDDVKYKYENGQNVLTIVKNI